jgi:agmatinase
MAPFDPDAAAHPDAGIFGLPDTRDDAHVVLFPVPFDATTSYGGGTHRGPAAILNASVQVDLFDFQFGRIYTQGIHMLPEPKAILKASKDARKLAAPIIAKCGADAKDRKTVAKIEKACELVNTHTYHTAWSVLAQGKVPGLIGGDHSTPFGAIRACAEYVERLQATERRLAPRDKGLGILHIDAHMDLRPAFEGFKYSHASIMYNVLSEIPEVTRLVQVGIRDFGEFEHDFAESQGRRVVTNYDLDWSTRLSEGESFSALAAKAVRELPQYVYISFDIDGLDPSLCPNTGTPVPGGLSFNQAAVLLKALVDAGKKVVGFDLVEVCPSNDPKQPEWDANVGARVLYKLCGAAIDRSAAGV